MFLYEMIPVTFPGPFDDAFAVAGSTGNALLLSIVALRKKTLFGLVGNSELSQDTKIIMPIDSVRTIDIRPEEDHMPSALPSRNSELEGGEGPRISEVQKNETSLGDEVKSLGAEVLKMAWKNPKIKQTLIDKSKTIAKALNPSQTGPS
jgi:hypothetical protein